MVVLLMYDDKIDVNMLDINFIKENSEKLKEAVKNKQLEATVDIGKLLSLHEDYLEILKKVEDKRAQRNKISEDISKASKEAKGGLIDKASIIKEELQEIEKELVKQRELFEQEMAWVPNIPADDVPIGQDDRFNKVVKTQGKTPKFSFKPKDHIEIGESLGILDIARGTKIAGFRGYFLRGEGADLEQAILRYALDLMKKHGFTFLSVPWMVKPEFFFGTGFFPWGEDDHYKISEDKSLIGTSEVSLTSYHANETLDEKDLPVKLVGYSPCFRKEIGAHGKDTRGIFRVHQFSKIEQVVLVENNEKTSIKWHEKMLKYSEEVLKGLGLHYQVVLMCTGDMGAGQRKKYDIETWFPSIEKFRETHSDSYFSDFQSRRLNIKYKAKDGSLKFVHTLNNTVAATPRLVAALLENHQQKDGSVVIPKALRSYTGFKKISPKKPS